MHHLMECLLLILTGSAVYCDFRSDRIPNRLLLAGLAGAVGFRLIKICGALGGDCADWLLVTGRQCVQLLSGLCLPLLLLGGFYLLRTIGAGDVKLLCVTGAYTGPGAILTILFYSFLFSALLSAGLLIKRGNLHSRFRYLKVNLSAWLLLGMRGSYLEHTDRTGRLHLSFPIFLGVSAFLLTG